MRYGRFVYYQPNKKDVRNRYGDCTIRALSKALDCTWLEAFDRMIPICREEQADNIFDVPIDVRKKLMERLGFSYRGVSVRGGKRRPTVDEFARTHKEGTYIANVANHVVAVVDGKYYDTWDSGGRPMYGYFIKG